MLKKLLSILLFSLVLSACSHTNNNIYTLTNLQAYLTYDKAIKLPSALNYNFNYKQLLTIKYEKEEHSLIVILNHKKNHLQLSALSVFGLRLFDASYQNNILSYSYSIKIDKLPKVEQVLADILLCYYKIEDLKPMLNSNFNIEDKLGQRLIKYQNKIIKSIDFNDQNQPIKINSFEFAYTIEIEYLE